MTHESIPDMFTPQRFRIVFALIATLLTYGAGVSAAEIVAQAPLSVRGDVPGNLLLVPSVEWPTLDSMANLGNYDVTRSYVGYFDPDQCYLYSYDQDETKRHFYPISDATSHACAASKKYWSGNYLNWAATQTIDPFRKALTGGYRVVDTATETWLEKARSDANTGDSIYPDRRIPASNTNQTLVKGATGTEWSSFKTRIRQLGNKMRFTRDGDLYGSTIVAYNPDKSLDDDIVYEVSVRVKVCVSGKEEANCKQYSQASKPEGLIQKYSERIRYSVFGYLNDSDMLRDGGVLRAQQKFVGDKMIDPKSGTVDNPNREWNPTTGVLVRNPDTTDATATTSVVGKAIEDSGVINYINKFGQMTTQNHKSHDPVSELYYTAIRYLKNQGNVSQYTKLSGTSTQKFNLADGFPIITAWDDPMQYSCQNNAILGIGDANTHRDKNLPGNKVTTDEPSLPAEVSADKTIDVVTATQKVAALEGISIATPFNSGRRSSAYIAGLAYDSHTKDLRDDLAKMQTVSTHWVDVREAQVLEPRTRNQYWLAAKYGGFKVPNEFDPYKQTQPLELASWSSGETLSTGDLRPKNFYVASEADKMVESLTNAFAKISTEAKRGGASLAANSTRLETGTMTFQAQFNGGTWDGELLAYSIDKDGKLKQEWQASGLLDGAKWSARKIYTQNGSGKYVPFVWDSLSSSQQTALGSQDIVNYLRGDTSKEEGAKGKLRARASILGDIINSTPVYVGAPNARLYGGASFTGASAYSTFASGKATRRGVVYVGANDGMLHGFDAKTGAETYAFVPNTAIVNGLKNTSDPNYEHRYFVDGELAIADVYDGAWKTVLVGTLGRGGPGVFALDVTDPDNVSFLWEKNASNIPALGRNLGRPIIAQVGDGDWRVFLGNGPDSSSGAAQLISLSISNGSAVTIDVGNSPNNGLSAVLARDSDGDRFADVAYAGDLKGNLWKFSGLDGKGTGTKLFTAVDAKNVAQPITAAPLAGKDPATGAVWVFFGTGRYLNSDDLKNLQIQSWYGLKDTGSSISGRSSLVQRDIVGQSLLGTTPVRVIEEGTVAEMSSKRGWFIDLKYSKAAADGERMVLPNRFQGVALIGTTRTPEADDPCNPTGTGYVMAIDPFTGARLTNTFFDVNGDGLFNEDDKIDADGDGKKDVVTGIGMPSIPSDPNFIGDNMYVGLDDGSIERRKVQGADVQASRMSWRELLNQ